MSPGRRPDADAAASAWRTLAELGGIATAADLQRAWGLTQQRVHQLTSLEAFPTPISSGRGALWLAAEVDEWSRHHNTRLGRRGPRAANLRPLLSPEDGGKAARTAWATVLASGGLVTVADLAERWGITDRAARERTKRDGFPDAVALGRWLSVDIRLAIRAEPDPFSRVMASKDKNGW